MTRYRVSPVSLRCAFLASLLLCLFPHAVHAENPTNPPVGGGGTCTQQTVSGGYQGIQMAFNNGLYGCSAGGAWVSEALLLGSALGDGTAASCNSTNTGMLEYTGGTFQGCNGTSFAPLATGMGVCHALYNFAVDGGAVGTITPATNCTIPAKAIFVAATLYISTIPQSANNTATIAIGTNAAGGLGSNQFFASASLSSYVATFANGRPTFASPGKVTGSGNVTVTIGTQALTAGVFELWVLYYVGTN